MVNNLYLKAKTKVRELKFGSLFLKIVIFVLICVSLYRLSTQIADFVTQDLQLDFSAFFTAGDALNHGLNPYKNNVSLIPTVWDGFDRYSFSRFLYPPLTATLFRPIALLGYPDAKFVWTIFSLVCLALSLIIFARLFNRPKDTITWWPVILVFIGFFFPIIPFIERGQIDSVTLLLIYLALLLMLKQPQWGIAAGMLLVFATLLKLNCIYFIPFFLIRKRYNALLGYGAGAILVILLTFTFNGIDNTFNYVFTEFPRISANGENGTPDQVLPRSDFSRVRGYPGRYVFKDPEYYIVSSIVFEDNASLTRPLHELASIIGIDLNISFMSLAVFLIFFLIVILWERLHKAKSDLTSLPRNEFLFWQLVMLIVLLASPLTWMMNLVWVFPLFFLPIYYFRNTDQLNSKLSMPLLIIGLIIIAVPDLQNSPIKIQAADKNTIWATVLTYASYFKYFIGELFLLAGLLLEYLNKAGKTAWREPAPMILSAPDSKCSKLQHQAKP